MSMGPRYVLFGKVSMQVLWPFFSWVVFLVLSCISSLYILEIKPRITCVIGKYILPFSGFPFHFVDDFFCCIKAFQFHVVPLFIFSFVSLAQGDISRAYDLIIREDKPQSILNSQPRWFSIPRSGPLLLENGP